jgi:hypothetical protein
LLSITLEDRLSKSSKKTRNDLLVYWTLQVGGALESLQQGGHTRLDTKPSNTALGSQQNAILIDIGGTGGFTLEWLSPEMAASIQQNTEMIPINAPFEDRVATDCWAYGRLLSSLGGRSSTVGFSCFVFLLQRTLMLEISSLSHFKLVGSTAVYE